MNLHGNHTRNVRITTNGNPRKQLTCAPFSQLWYYQVKRTPGLCQNVWKTISFALALENFGIRYVGREHADHLMSALKIYYEKITIDW